MSDAVILCILRCDFDILKTERMPERWCFKCRKRIAGENRLLSEPYPSYYDPHWSYKCDGCHQDQRLFPGWEWKWDE